MKTLYRVFRPDNFDKVVGQDNITQILKNQVESSSVRHAYLFHGSRGTGKTSCAKILARAVNCLAPKNGNPCNECEACISIIEEKTLDVVEMDAASNRRIDDIRDMREKIKYLPADLKKRVIIIDEAHMITQEGFNALLKTLEEPPGHLLFILATTEKEKIPATITSRCQIFTFQRINVDFIKENMKYVLKEIGREADEEALDVLAYGADGAMRDALSVLEQALAITDGKITLADVENVTGAIPEERLFAFTEAIFNKEPEPALSIVEDLRQAGKETEIIIKDITEHYRKLLISGSTNDLRLFAGTKEQFEKYKKAIAHINKDILLEGMRLLLEAQGNLRYTDDAATLLTVSVIRLVDLAKKKTLEERITELENYLYSGKAPVIERIEESPPESEPILSPKEPEDFDLYSMDFKVESPNEPEVELKPIEEIKSKSMEETESKPIEKNESDLIESEEKKEEIKSDKEESFTKEDWLQAIDNIRKRSVQTWAYLRECKLLSSDDKKITVVFPDEYGIHRDTVQRESHIEIIKEEVKRIAGKDMGLNFILEKERQDKTQRADLQSIIDYFGAENIEFK